MCIRYPISKLARHESVIAAFSKPTTCISLVAMTKRARIKQTLTNLPYRGSKNNSVSRHASSSSTDLLQPPSSASDEPTHTLPDDDSAKAARAAFESAAAAAEAQQQLLLSSGSPLAQLMDQHSKLHTIFETYSTVQSLHHEAIRQLLYQYGSTAASLPGLTYACLVHAVQQLNPGKQDMPAHISKRSGDSITYNELSSLFEQMVATTPDHSSELPLSLFAEALYLTTTSGMLIPDSSSTQLQLLSDLRLLVLPDVMTLLLESLHPGAAAATGHLPSDQRQHVCWKAEQQGHDGQVQVTPVEAFQDLQHSSQHHAALNRSIPSEQLVLQLLQQGLRRPTAADVPLRIEDVASFVAALGGMR